MTGCMCSITATRGLANDPKPDRPDLQRLAPRQHQQPYAGSFGLTPRLIGEAIDAVLEDAERYQAARDEEVGHLTGVEFEIAAEQ